MTTGSPAPRGRRLDPARERDLAMRAAVGALTAVAQLRAEQEAEAVQHRDDRRFSAPERAVRRGQRGTWGSRF